MKRDCIYCASPSKSRSVPTYKLFPAFTDPELPFLLMHLEYLLFIAVLGQLGAKAF